MQGQKIQMIIGKTTLALLTSTLLLQCLAQQAIAADLQTLWQPGWQCGKVATVSKKFVQNLVNHNALYGYRLNNKYLPLLLGQDPESSGAILFVQNKGKWRAYPIAQGSTVLNMYSTPAYNRLTLFATWGNQGVSTDYITLNGTQQLTQFSCATVHLPAELNRPNWGKQYPGLHDFNIDTSGKGSLISATYLAHGKQSQKHWYQYQTTNWGKNWTDARSIKAPKGKTKGIFQAATESAHERQMVNHLLKSLR